MPNPPLAQLFSLSGQVAIVTGGAKGIGHGIAERLAEAGATVVISDVDDSAGAAAASGIGGEFVHANMSVEDDLKRLVAQTVEHHGRVDVLVNNAGIYPVKPALEMSAEEWDTVQAVNLRGLFLLSREFANAAKQRGAGGSIINIGSIDSLHPSSVGLAAYDASRAASSCSPETSRWRSHLWGSAST